MMFLSQKIVRGMLESRTEKNKGWIFSDKEYINAPLGYAMNICYENDYSSDRRVDVYKLSNIEGKKKVRDTGADKLFSFMLVSEKRECRVA